MKTETSMENQKYWKKSACPYDCPDSCGLLLETDGTTVYRVKGDPDHPVTHGFICQKMQHYEKTIHHPDRILTPLRRIGDKGSGQFQAITWDEALCEIRDRWREIIRVYGSEAILPYSFAGNLHLVQNKCGDAFFHRLGASRLERTICSKAKTAGFSQMIGRTGGINPDDIRYSDLIIIWGSNLNATMLHAHAQVVEARRRGVPVILIETYRTPTAALADEVILLPPGTDGALALAMANTLKRHRLTDRAFIREHTSGWRHFASSLTRYTPQWAEKITGIPAETIERLADAYGRARAPLIIFGSGYSRQSNGALTTRCICALPALTGAFLKKGGGIIGNIATAVAFDVDMVRRPDLLKKETRAINMNQIGSALCGDQVNAAGEIIGRLDPPVMSLYVYNSNPVDVAPAQKKVIAGLKREDLFTVVHERFMTDTARFADIILPADTSVEHYNLTTPYGNYAVSVTAPVIPPPGECKSNWDTFCLLAKKMGFRNQYFKYTNEEIVRMVAERENGIRARWTDEEKAAFDGGEAVLLHADYEINAPDGRIEFYSPQLEFPMPAYVPYSGGDYPLRLIVAPSVYTLNSTFTERKDLVDRRGRSVLKINPRDAYERGIADGNIIEAFNDLAAVEFFAEVTEDVLGGTVVAEGVYRLSDSMNQLTVNALLSERLTDGGRASTLCGNTVDIRKL